MPLNQRLTLLPVALVAMAAIATPALAGTDGDDEAPPAATPGPVPFVQAPAPVPVATPVPTAPPLAAPEESTPTRRVANRRHKSKPRAVKRSKPRAVKHSAPARVLSAKAASGFPRGGVQAGGGGTAR